MNVNKNKQTYCKNLTLFSSTARIGKSTKNYICKYYVHLSILKAKRNVWILYRSFCLKNTSKKLNQAFTKALFATLHSLGTLSFNYKYQRKWQRRWAKWEKISTIIEILKKMICFLLRKGVWKIIWMGKFSRSQRWLKIVATT